MWKTVLLKKSSNFKTLLSWWKRYSRPPEQQTQSFKDIWLLPGDTRWIETRLPYIEREIKRLVVRLTNNRTDSEDNYENFWQGKELIDAIPRLFKIYDDATRTTQIAVDDLSNYLWKFHISGLKRKRYPGLATDRVKERRLKQLIPDKFINEFSEQDMKNIYEALSSPRQNRALKNMLEMLNENSDPEFQEQMIRMIKEVGREARR